DVVDLGARAPEPVDAARVELNAIQERNSVVVELARSRLLEDRRELPFQLPRVEEELPVDVVAQRCAVDVDFACAEEWWDGHVVECDSLFVLTRGGERKQGLAVALRVLRAQAVLQLAVVPVERHAAPRVEQIADDADDA